jgi:excisionase family DNA binding protein
MRGARQAKRKSNYYNSISAMLTVREASQLLFVDENTLRHWTNQGKIKAYNLGRRGDCRYKREDVAALLQENKHSQADGNVCRLG